MFQLTDATVLVNNEAVAIVPNSLAYTEGFGEQDIRAASVGGGKTEQVYTRDLESNFSMVKFSLHATPENIKLARSWKSNANKNVVQIAGQNDDGDVTRTFTQSALINDYEVPIGTETEIEVEFKANAAI